MPDSPSSGVPLWEILLPVSRSQRCLDVHTIRDDCFSLCESVAHGFVLTLVFMCVRTSNCPAVMSQMLVRGLLSLGSPRSCSSILEYQLWEHLMLVWALCISLCWWFSRRYGVYLEAYSNTGFHLQPQNTNNHFWYCQSLQSHSFAQTMTTHLMSCLHSGAEVQARQQKRNNFQYRPVRDKNPYT